MNHENRYFLYLIRCGQFDKNKPIIYEKKTIYTE